MDSVLIADLIDRTARAVVLEQNFADTALPQLRTDLTAAFERTPLSPNPCSPFLILASGWAGECFNDFLAPYGLTFLGDSPSLDDDGRDWHWRIDDEHALYLRVHELFHIDACLVTGPYADALLAVLSTRLQFLDSDELMTAHRAALGDVERRAATYALALSAQPVTFVEIRARLAPMLSDFDPLVRSALIQAGAQTGVINRDEIEFACHDLDERVRASAERALSAHATMDV